MGPTGPAPCYRKNTKSEIVARTENLGRPKQTLVGLRPKGDALLGIVAGNTKAVLKDYGPYITRTGAGSGGADVSEAYTTNGYNT